MVAIICTLLSGLAFYASSNLGVVWPLAWFAPVPILWLAYGETSWVVLATGAFCAVAIGMCNLLPAYGSVLPTVVLAVAFIGAGVSFAAAVCCSRLVARRVGPLWGVLAYATTSTSLFYLASLTDSGTQGDLANSQAMAPLMVQTASVFGIWSIDFLMGFVAAALALALETRRVLPVLLAVTLFAGNLAFGLWHMQTPQGPKVRVALIDSDALNQVAAANDRETAMRTIGTYADAAGAMTGTTLTVLSEKIAVVEPQWRKGALARFTKSAKDSGATVVAGLDSRAQASRRNIAWVFSPDGRMFSYTKRQLVPGLESRFQPGDGPLTLKNGIGVEICKDMDFPAMIRRDAIAGHPSLVAVPAWDFGADGVYHARLAILRGVENGFAVARSARDGLLTLSDAHGRILAMRRSAIGDTVTLLGSLPRGTDGGQTIYDRIGDVFAWVMLAVTVLLLGFSLRPKRA